MTESMEPLNLSIGRIHFELKEWLLTQVFHAIEYPLSLVATSQDFYVKTLGSNSGVYVLYHNKTPVYVGKVSGEDTRLRGRIRQHYNKIKLSTIPIEMMTCKLIPVPERELVLSAEEILINHLKPSWNELGFGGKNDIRWRIMWDPQ